jgi:hypothetical protein
MIWQTNRRTFDLTSRGVIMGIVNVTPDSFSDGGTFGDTDAAVAHGLRLAAVTLNAAHGEPAHVCGEKRLEDVRQFVRTDNGDDELHVLFLVKKGGDASKAKGVPTFFSNDEFVF